MDPRLELASALGEDISTSPQDGTTTKAVAQQQVANPASRTEDKSPLEGITVEQLLADQELSKQLKSWSDGEAAKQLQGKTEAIRRQVRQELEPQLRQELTDVQLREYFQQLDSDGLAEVLASNPEAAKAYGRLAAQTDTQSSQSTDAAAMVNGMAVTIATWNRLLQASDLSPERKAALDPGVALDVAKGPSALPEWTQAIQNELIQSEAGKLVEKNLEERWQSFKEEHLAVLEETNPRGASLINGRLTSPLPDVLENSGAYLIEDALARKPQTNGKR